MNRKNGIRGNALEINGCVRSDAPEVLSEHSEDFLCPGPPVPSVLFQQKGKLGSLFKSASYLISSSNVENCFFSPQRLGLDSMSLIIHHLDSIGEITTSVPLQWMIDLAGGCKGSGGWNVGIWREERTDSFYLWVIVWTNLILIFTHGIFAPICLFYKN